MSNAHIITQNGIKGTLMNSSMSYDNTESYVVEYVSHDTVLVYNYKDGKVYTLTKSY